MTKTALLTLITLILVYALFGFYTVGSDEMGVVTLLGRVIADRVPPGIHYRIPWPFTRVYTPSTGIIKRMSIGFKIVDQMQGRQPSADESERFSGDSNVLVVAMMVQYSVRDPADYLFRTEDPDFLVRKVGEAFLGDKVGQLGVDDLLTVIKAEVEQCVRQGMQGFLDSIGAGLRIRSCNLQKVEPPQEVIESFNDVSIAKANREQTINDARAYQSELIPRARAQAQQNVQNAEAKAATRKGQAEGDVARFQKVLSQYEQNPEVLRQRLYWETVQEILSRAQKFIVEKGDGKNRGTTIRLLKTSP